MTHPERKKRRRLIFEAVKAGQKVLDVAEKFGVSEHLVYHACVEHGGCEYTQSDRRYPLGINSYTIIASLINTDRFLTDIAKEAQVSIQRIGQIYHACLNAGIPVRIRTLGGSKPGWKKSEKGLDLVEEEE